MTTPEDEAKAREIFDHYDACNEDASEVIRLFAEALAEERAQFRKAAIELVTDMRRNDETDLRGLYMALSMLDPWAEKETK